MLPRVAPATLLALLCVAAVTAAGSARAAAQTPATCPTGVALAVTPPDAAAATTVTVALTPAVALRLPAAGEDGAFTLYYFLDTPPVAAGAAIPSGDPRVFPGASAAQDLGPLTAGTHTVAVVLGTTDRTACEVVGATTFLVGQSAGRAPGAPKLGNAGLADSGTSSLVIVVLIAVTVAVVVGARLWGARRR